MIRLVKYLPESEHSTAVEGVRFAFENGVNYFDLAAGDGKAFPIFRDALEDVRSQVLYQIHFGADYSKGTYGWTLDLDQVKRSVDWQLGQLNTPIFAGAAQRRCRQTRRYVIPHARRDPDDP